MILFGIECQVSEGHVGVDVVVSVDGDPLDVPVEVLERREHGAGELVKDPHEDHHVVLPLTVQPLPVLEPEVVGQRVKSDHGDVLCVTPLDEALDGMGGGRYGNAGLPDLDRLVEHHGVLEELSSNDEERSLRLLDDGPYDLGVVGLRHLRPRDLGHLKGHSILGSVDCHLYRLLTSSS